ncbi:Mut7-C RNAse domain-containing protein [Gracilinema caldarium]|uniref:Mut7-C RNAse domain-containing protein n=1 Tax=Gracilinema caldarium TaxID=215591 RepID=UPI0026E9565B|nr:Mut7-C RNAse domain-containing protein [Gracilinema caldarium]
MIHFIADVHLGKLARILRLLGFSVYYRNNLEDAEIANLASQGDLVVLSRDRELLKRRLIKKSLYITSTDPIVQTVQVISVLGLEDSIHPFTRCSLCGASLCHADKSAVYEILPPSVRDKYDTFYQCSACGKLFWKGDHFRTMTRLFERLLDKGLHLPN